MASDLQGPAAAPLLPLVMADGVTPMKREASVFHGGGLRPNFRGSDLLSQEMGGYWPGLTSPTAELYGERDQLVARSQDLTRNNGFASGVKQSQLDSIIGKGWRLQPTPNREVLGLSLQGARKWAAQVKAKFQLWADDPECWIDYGERQRFSGLLRTQFTTWFGAGEHCARMEWLPDRVRAGSTKYSTAVQLIDPDRLSNPNGAPEMPDLRMGVQLGGRGEALGFHIRDAHPADWPNAFLALTWTYVPRKTSWGRPQFIHGFEMERAGSVRGKPPLASIVESLRLLDVYERGEATSAVLNALYAATIETDFGNGDPDVAKEIFGTDPQTGGALSPNIDLRLRGVKVPVLPPGLRLKFNTMQRQAAQFEQFEAAFLRRVAAATGSSYEQVSRDYSRTNYSSARASLLEAWKFLTGRGGFMADSFADPVFACWLEEAINIGEIVLPKGAPDFYAAKAAWTSCRWIGPGKGWIDPVKEVQASVMKIDAGLSTLEKECAEQGEDWLELADQRAFEADELKKRGLDQQSKKVYLANSASITREDQPEQKQPEQKQAA